MRGRRVIDEAVGLQKQYTAIEFHQPQETYNRRMEVVGALPDLAPRESGFFTLTRWSDYINGQHFSAFSRQIVPAV